MNPPSKKKKKDKKDKKEKSTRPKCKYCGETLILIAKYCPKCGRSFT